MQHDNERAARALQREVEKQRWAERRLKKDAVLHLRIEGDIMDRIKAEAENRDMSVSDLVRGYLIECFTASHADEGMPDFLLATSAFSDVVIVRDSRCAVCGEPIPPGTGARLAHGPLPPPRLVCGHCFDNVLSQFEEQQELSPGEE